MEETPGGREMMPRSSDRLQITGSQLWRDHLIGMVAITVAVTTVFALRCYARLTSGTRLMLEDWTCTIAWGMLMLYCATVFVMIANGEGHHIWELSKHQYINILMWLYGSSIIYIPAAYVTKVTLLLLITRVFAIRRRVVQGLHIFMAVLLVAYLPIQIMKTAVCVPIRAYWLGKEAVPGARCMNQRQLFISDLALATITDCVVLFVPVPLTWTLRVSRARKLKIVALLGAGGCAMAVTIYRMYKVIVFLNTTDLPFDFALIDLLTTLEISIGLICACLPSVNLLVERLLLDRRQRASSHSTAIWGSPRSPNSPRTLDSGFSSRLRKLKRDSGKFLPSSLGRTSLFGTQSSPADKTETETWTRTRTLFSEECGLAPARGQEPQHGDTRSCTDGRDHTAAPSDDNVESIVCVDGSIHGNTCILFCADDADNIELDVEKQMASGKPIVMPPRGDGLSSVAAQLSSSDVLSLAHAAAQSGSIVNVSAGTGSPSARAASVETSGSGGILKTVQVTFAGDDSLPDPSGPSQQRHQPRPHHDNHHLNQQNYPVQIMMPSPDRIWDGTGSRPPFHRSQT